MQSRVLERRLLLAAATFVVLYALILTLSPAVRERSLAAGLRYSHWIGVAVWAGTMYGGVRILNALAPDRDPLLLPIAAILSGWGVLSIWRLDPGFGARQTVWLVVSMAAALALVRYVGDAAILRRYKYLLLSAGLALTAATIVLGTSPTTGGPRLWLGCCGLYFQPSEPLKLLLILYLAAYLADHMAVGRTAFPLVVPTFFVTGLAIALLMFQRDLGTASILIMLYTVMLYLATGQKRVLVAAALAVALAGMIGYGFVGIVQARLESWINPWSDPSGRSYQIVQSLLAVANGGILGRGPGIGNPGLVPVAHSDFIFSALAEETGLIGTVGALLCYAVFVGRGLGLAVRAPDNFARLLLAGISAYVGVQAILIVGGNLRLLPLTGVTLPFMSYGGSSLLTSFVALGVLLLAGPGQDGEPASMRLAAPYQLAFGCLLVGLAAVSVTQGWWALARRADLLERFDNARRSIADRYVRRGSLLDRNQVAIDVTVGESGSYVRVYEYPVLGAVSGYTHASFGQAGLEDSLDPYLRGLQGNPASLVLWNEVAYGTPPPGLDVRLSIDLGLQAAADAALGSHHGAIVMLDATSGEILAMASHPTFDANNLDTTGALLATDTGAPLLNRAALGAYPLGGALAPFDFAVAADGSAGAVHDAAAAFGLRSAPALRLPTSSASQAEQFPTLHASPLQMALATAALANDGTLPAPRIALATDTPAQGWVILPPLGDRRSAVATEAAKAAAEHFAIPGEPFWEWASTAADQTSTVGWFCGGTLPDWQGVRVAVAVLLESGDQPRAIEIGRHLLAAATAR
jgi:cell division protein FtsW (lipid II flippase)